VRGKSENAQALIEFILILPVLLLILFALIDFGRLFFEKIQLENRLQNSLEILTKKNNYEEALKILNEGQAQKATLETEYQESYLKVKTTLEIPLLTPGLSLLLKDFHQIKIERTVPYEMESSEK